MYPDDFISFTGPNGRSIIWDLSQHDEEDDEKPGRFVTGGLWRQQAKALWYSGDSSYLEEQSVMALAAKKVAKLQEENVRDLIASDFILERMLRYVAHYDVPQKASELIISSVVL
ncbi:hypothetical protein FRB96_005657 [Tulasnella sp. 330]|nr:hypothetical protein FRB96_005657 [Tulasnella sp. 330]